MRWPAPRCRPSHRYRASGGGRSAPRRHGAGIERNYQARLAGALPGADATPRAALLIAICAGVILDRMLLGHTELNSPGTENLIPYLHAALDAVAKAAEPAPGS